MLNLILALSALAGCTADGPTGDSGEAEPSVLVPLDAPRLARRMSLDLRGVLPSDTELAAVEADADALAELQEVWLQDPRLEDRLVALYQERWHTLVDELPLIARDFGLDPEDEYRFERAVGEEPLRLMARIAATDRPWTDVVTADHTQATALLAELWNLALEDGDGHWRQARYTDGRPAVGVLASNGLWWRYPATPFNYNRGRAAAISRLLLCENPLGRPVSFDAPNLLDEDGTEEAVRENPGCLACHSSLDPVAAMLFGFWWYDIYDPTELVSYHPEREPLGEDLLGVTPSWYGQDVPGLPQLGVVVAADTRFLRCAVQTLAEGLWRRAEVPDDFAEIDRVRRDFVDSGLLARAALRSLLAGETYRAGGVLDGAPADVAEREITRRLLAPRVLASVVEDLTGFMWEQDGFALMDVDSHGYRVMAGGVDGVLATRPQAAGSVAWSLVVQRLAEGAAAQALSAVLDDGIDVPLLQGVSLDAVPGEAGFTEDLEVLWWRLLAVRPTSAEVAGLTTLWQSLQADHGERAAWAGVLSALLRHPDFVSA